MDMLAALFDVNGSYGRTSTGNLEFPTIQSRVDHMDRLGIAQSLVWNIESKEFNAPASNRNFLAELDRTRSAKGRIIPALAVSGLMHYENGAVTALKKQMRDRGLRALRFANVYGRLTLCQLEPVIRAIRSLKPFIVMRHDESNIQDILDFTSLFPEIPLILTEVMWGPHITVLDLMRRRNNIMLDNSWLHTDGAIELAVKHFGSERLFFGTGYRSHNGAAVAALALADISPADRERIAHGNLEHLLGFSAKAKKLPACKADGAEKRNLWRKCLSGKALGVDIVDAHGHVGPSGGYVLESHEEPLQIRRALKCMDKLGVGAMIVSGLQALSANPMDGNDSLERLLRPCKGRILGYVAFNPHYADELSSLLDRYFASPVFVGFKTLCSYWKVKTDDVRLKPMLVYADKHRLPILYHTWGTDDVVRLKDVVKEYPGAQFLLGHSGGSAEGHLEAEKLALENQNVSLEWCGSFCHTLGWDETLRKLDPRQILFGTDAMAHDFNWELGRLLSLDVPDKVLVQILGQNMRRILAMRK